MDSLDPREQIEIFKPIANTASYGIFPVTDKCERTATLMGDDTIKLAFTLTEQRIQFEAFSYIIYEGKHYFLRERYRPTPQGSEYNYEMIFVSAANMLAKSLFMRYYQVPIPEAEGGGYRDVQPEPEVNVNADLTDMLNILVRSIIGASDRVPMFANTKTVYANLISTISISADDRIEGTELKTFSFESNNIVEVLNNIADQYETEWWITEENGAIYLHICKCEEMVEDDNHHLVPATPDIVSDIFTYENGKAKPYSSKGLMSVGYAQEWSNIPQKLLAFGSERNIVRTQALDELGDKDVYVSYGKRLRLAPNTTYTVKKSKNSQETDTITTDEFGAVTNPFVTSGIEKNEIFDDIYPQGHFVVETVVRHESGYFTIEGRALEQNSDGTPKKVNDDYVKYSWQEMNTPVGQTVVVDGVTKQGLGIVPLTNKTQDEDLKIHFESGWLNGREFGVRRNNSVTITIGGVDFLKLSLDIVPDGNEDESLELPNEDFYPQVGDMFAIFNMDMPQGYVDMAEQRLAQATYEKLVEYQNSRPDVKCKSEPIYFSRLSKMALGKRFSVYSELFGDLVYIDGDINKGIDEQNSPVFTSRVTAFSHSLTTPEDVDFTLSSGMVAGSIATLAAMIADSTSELRGLEQRHINLSKRGWHDSEELSQMLESLMAEMMLVGNAKYQFQYTFGIVLDEDHIHNVVNGVAHTKTLTINGGGCIQHTQKPYIDYPNQGIWYVEECVIDLSEKLNGEYIYDRDKAYYLYAIVNSDGARITNDKILLSETKCDGTGYEMYMLLGILSSEYEDKDTLDEQGHPTSYRVFNRTNGYTAITGGTITTEQVQDANRQLIIDFQHNPPRIVAVNGAEVFGNIRFKSMLTEDGKNAGEEIFKEIGGENLYTGVDPLRITLSSGSVGVVAESSKKYVVSIQSVTGTASDNKVRVYEKTVGGGGVITHTLIGTIDVNANGMSYCVVEGHGREIELRCSANQTDKYYDLTGVMVQQGEKPTTYQPTYKYLAEAFEHDATKQTTDINGGLLATSLVLLRNHNNQVRAGISGLDDDGKKIQDGAFATDENSHGVGFFAGGSYAEALAAAAGNGDIPVLLTKDGIFSRIGCFRVVDKDTVKVVSGEKTIIITNKTINQVAPLQKSYTYSYEEGESVNDEGPVPHHTGGATKSDYGVFNAKTMAIETGGTYTVKISQLAIYQRSSMHTSLGDDSAQIEADYTLRFEILNNNSVVYQSENMRNGQESDIDGDNRYYDNSADASLSTQTVQLNLAAGTLTFRFYGEYFIYARADAYDDYASASSSIKAKAEIDIKGIDKYVVLANDGEAIIANSESAFYIYNDGNQLDIVAKGLPSRADAKDGGLYLDGEFVKRKSTSGS